MRRLPGWFGVMVAVWALLPWAAAGQASDKAGFKGADAKDAKIVEPVKLGDAAAALTGPWRFHIGDDPAWAQPDVDDSGWEQVDLTPPARGEVPGWTAQGHPGYAGFAWYRIKVDVEGAKRSLAVEMPESADDAYQVFVNGKMVGEFGKFSGSRVTAYGSMPEAFRLPKEVRNGPMTIAIRMWMDHATPFNSPDAGGLHGPPEVGYAAAISGEVRLAFDAIAHAVGSGFLEALILFMALLMGAALFWLDRDEQAYLWLALVCAVTLLGNSVVLLANFTTPVGQTTGVIIYDVISQPIRIGLWVIFWSSWFRISRMRRVHRVVWPAVAALMLATAVLRPPLYGEIIPVHTARYFLIVQTVAKLSLGAMLLFVAYFGFKRRRRSEGSMAGAAIMLAFAGNFQHELRLIHIFLQTSVFGFSINLGQMSTMASLLIITVMLLRRFVITQRQQELWSLEIAQARDMQQVLIPETLPKIDGLKIESVYRPAREVGGDFFQIIPGEAGEALIVVGDVTGKGMQAGMLVALIVGAIRSAAQHSSEPAQIMAWVNDQLCDREHASATCMVLRIERNGAVHLSHAGHLPPYLNGKEMEIEGAFPLGSIGGIEFPTASFQLKERDSLLLMSDGIAEAQDSGGALFGFERIERMLAMRSSPADIADAAQRFGQEDDILVLQVQWTGTVQEAPMVDPEFAVL